MSEPNGIFERLVKRKNKSQLDNHRRFYSNINFTIIPLTIRVISTDRQQIANFKHKKRKINDLSKFKDVKSPLHFMAYQLSLTSKTQSANIDRYWQKSLLVSLNDHFSFRYSFFHSIRSNWHFSLIWRRIELNNCLNMRPELYFYVSI